MAMKPNHSRVKAAKRAKNALKPGEITEIAGLYRADMSKAKATLEVGEPAPPAPLKGERWSLVLAAKAAPTEET